MSDDQSKESGAKEVRRGAAGERRRTKRTAILNTFSLYLVIPKKGVHRLPIHDLSDMGIGFDLDIEGENPTTFPIEAGEMIDLQLYLNQSLFLPLFIRVARISQEKTLRRVGAEFTHINSKSHMALLAFLDMLDGIFDAVRIDHPPT